MGEDDKDIPMNETEKRELALSEVILILLAIIGVCAVIWLGWFA